MAGADHAFLDPDGTFLLRLAQDRAVLTELEQGLWKASPEEMQRRLADLEVLAHQLGGAAGTFGYPAVSAAALELEDRVGMRREAAESLGYRLAIESALIGLVRALDDALGT